MSRQTRKHKRFVKNSKKNYKAGDLSLGEKIWRFIWVTALIIVVIMAAIAVLSDPSATCGPVGTPFWWKCIYPWTPWS